MAKPKKKYTEPVSLPMLPLRGLMVFPHMVLHFDAGRKKSIAALDQAMEENQRIFLVAQRDMDVDDPAVDDIYHVGTIACVKQVLRLPGGNVRLLVEGKSRAVLRAVTQEEPYFVGALDEVLEQGTPVSIETDALLRTAHHYFEEYCKMSGRISGPYYATMVINAFGLETMTLGRMTMPRFEKSQRVNDISLGSPNPYLSMAQKLRDFLPTATGYYPAEGYSGIAWADTMYPFVIPAALYGWYRLCRDRRRLALRGSEEPLRDGGMLILVWMFAAIINTTMVGAVVNRNNILYYPWILCAAYALWQMGRRLRTALAAMVVMIAIGFAGACGVYFTDADYQTETANTFLYGAQEALRYSTTEYRDIEIPCHIIQQRAIFFFYFNILKAHFLTYEFSSI